MPPSSTTDQSKSVNTLLASLNLDPENIGADSPEVRLRRERHQAQRQQSLRQETVQTPTIATDNTHPILQEDAPIDGNYGQINNPGKPNSSKSNPNTDQPTRLQADKDTKTPTENKEKEDSSQPDTKKGGGDEKKDPGVPQQPIADTTNPTTDKKKSGDEQKSSPSEQLTASKRQAMASLQDAKDKLRSGNIKDALGDVTMASKTISAWALTTMWGAVWLDYTLLTLLGLNVYFLTTNFTDKISAFGEDYLFGKWMPKELAKWFEVILLALMDMIVLSIFLIILYGGYKFYTLSFTDIIIGGAKGIISGDGATGGIIKRAVTP